MIQLRLICPDDEETTVETEVDIKDIAVQMTEDHTNEVKITDTVKIFLKYPVLKDMKGLAAEASEMRQIFSMLNTCVHEIHYGEQIFNKIDISEKDIDEFIDQLTTDQLLIILLIKIVITRPLPNCACSSESSFGPIQLNGRNKVASRSPLSLYAMITRSNSCFEQE